MAVMDHRRMLIREALQKLDPGCLSSIIRFIEDIAEDMGGDGFARHACGLVPSKRSQGPLAQSGSAPL